MSKHDWQALLNQYCDELARTHSPRTVSAYHRDGEALIDHLVHVDEEVTPDTLSTLDCRSLLAQLSLQGLSAVSLARHLSCYRQWFDYLLQKKICASNPWQAIKAPKREKRLPNALSPDETKQLLDHKDDSQQHMAARNQAMFELLYSSGLRVSECIGINLKDLDLHHHEVRVLGKGNKERIVPLGSQAGAALAAYLPERRHIMQKMALDPKLLISPVFINNRGERLSVRSLQDLLARRGRQSGMLSQVHPHRLRHAFASHVLQSSGDLRAVQEMLGHADIKSTQVYTHLDFQHLAKVYDNAHPRAKNAKTAIMVGYPK